MQFPSLIHSAFFFPLIEYWFGCHLALLPIEFPADVHGNAAENGPSTWVPATYVGRPKWTSWILVSDLAVDYLRNEPVA